MEICSSRNLMSLSTLATAVLLRVEASKPMTSNSRSNNSKPCCHSILLSPERRWAICNTLHQCCSAKFRIATGNSWPTSLSLISRSTRVWAQLTFSWAAISSSCRFSCRRVTRRSASTAAINPVNIWGICCSPNPSLSMVSESFRIC